MPTLNFTRFSGAISRCSTYDLAEQDGMLYIVPGRAACRYDPFEDTDSLLLDVVRAGAEVANCEPFLDYCLTCKILPLQDAAFWLYGDFFTAQPQTARPLVDTLLAFAGRYGLPVWDNVVTTTYPVRYAQRLLTLHQNDHEDMAHLVHYEAVKRACGRSGAVPACTLALLLLDFYLQFIEGIDGGHFFIRKADWMMAYGHEKTPRLTAQVYDLTTCIHLAHALASTGEGKAVRQCKHCQKIFIADDQRAAYCSPKCRGAYNSKMTRKRVKERKQQEICPNNGKI